MWTKRALSPLSFYLLLIGFFFIDLAVFSLHEKPLLFSLLCFYITQLAAPLTYPRIGATWLLASLESLIWYGRFGLMLGYLIPVTIIGAKMRHTFYESRGHYYLLLGGCIVMQKLVIEPLILPVSSPFSYTIVVLFVNIMVIGAMNLLKI